MTYPTGQVPPTAPTPYPQYPPQYPQYPQYPSYAAYPQYPPMPQWVLPVEQPPAPLRPLEEMPQGLAPDRYARIGAIIAISVVVVSVILATIAPLLVNHSSGVVPSNWAKVYDAQPSSSDGAWQTLPGCNFTSSGLHLVDSQADSDTAAECRFTPSTTQDLTSQGFYFEAVTAPPADVPNAAEAPVLVFGVTGNLLVIYFQQDGEFTACTDPCSASGGGLYSPGVAGSWYTNGYTANTIGVLYSPASQQVTLYANGQEAATFAYDAPPSSHILLSCDIGSEAIYTHVRIFSGTGS